MTATFALVLWFLSIASCIACYPLGQDSVRQQLRNSNERRRRWEEFDDED
jgi:hypothetical protein